MSVRWIPLIGTIEIADDSVTYRGKPSTTNAAGQPIYSVGLVLSDQNFGGGTIRAGVRLDAVSSQNFVGLVLYYEPQTRSFVEVQLGGGYFCAAWSQVNGQWVDHGGVGTGDQVKAGQLYQVEAWVKGSSVHVSIDNVKVLSSVLPITLPVGQAALYFHGEADVHVEGFTVSSAKPKAFVVMQFTPPFNELYEEVIKPVCAEFGLTAERADEQFGPGV